jgi:hypothetical protein|eukprot:COSAG06_NODE_2556_length_6673_cov_10.060542_1_plen_166_part_00
MRAQSGLDRVVNAGDQWSQERKNMRAAEPVSPGRGAKQPTMAGIFQRQASESRIGLLPNWQQDLVTWLNYEAPRRRGKIRQDGTKSALYQREVEFAWVLVFGARHVRRPLPLRTRPAPAARASLTRVSRACLLGARGSILGITQDVEVQHWPVLYCADRSASLPA